MSETRERIVSHVHAHPGVHFNRIVRTLDLAPGQVQYHHKTLLGQGTIESEDLYGRTHFYPSDCDGWDRQALALLRRETARDVVAVLLDCGPSRPTTVADELDIARSTLEWHVDRLVECDLVEKRRDRKNHVTLALERSDDIVRLLRDADPTLLVRMVDRFTRLVDRLLTE